MGVLDKDSCSPLVVALKEDSIDAFKVLLEAWGDVNVGGGVMGSALHLAAFKVKPWMVKELIERGANVTARDCEGNTPLHVVLGVFNKSPH